MLSDVRKRLRFRTAKLFLLGWIFKSVLLLVKAARCLQLFQLSRCLLRLNPAEGISAVDDVYALIRNN